MFLARERSRAVSIDNDWVSTFAPKPQDRWINNVLIQGGPARGTVTVTVEGDNPFAISSIGTTNMLSLYLGQEVLVPAGCHVFVRWTIDTGLPPVAILRTTLAPSRGWEDLPRG